MSSKTANPKKQQKKQDDKEEEKKEEENKFKAFTGKGVTLGGDIPTNQNMEMDNDMKQVMELSMNDFVQDLEKRLPKEPSEDDSSCYKISFRCENQTISRRFNPTDFIRDIKNFLQSKLRTYNDIELSEAFPRKVYSEESKKLSECGFSKNQTLNAKVLY